MRDWGIYNGGMRDGKKVDKSTPGETFELDDSWKMKFRLFCVFLDLFILFEKKMIVIGSR